MLIGGGAQGPIDWLARRKLEQQAKDIAELRAQVVELQVALLAVNPVAEVRADA
jgi:hypothetical protein